MDSETVRSFLGQHPTKTYTDFVVEDPSLPRNVVQDPRQNNVEVSVRDGVMNVRFEFKMEKLGYKDVMTKVWGLMRSERRNAKWKSSKHPLRFVCWKPLSDEFLQKQREILDGGFPGMGTEPPPVGKVLANQEEGSERLGIMDPGDQAPSNHVVGELMKTPEGKEIKEMLKKNPGLFGDVEVTSIDVLGSGKAAQAVFKFTRKVNRKL
ncbi:hypothetical protein ABW19_dt0206114 [Dactylella cylindrospora]|nr:hypothetical protein ABW19_dt0206114 [Dactylella cylindrospora]